MESFSVECTNAVSFHFSFVRTDGAELEDTSATTGKFSADGSGKAFENSRREGDLPFG